MVIFYRLPGFLASIALAIYVVLILALFKLIPVTLTLAGVGGLILSIGMYLLYQWGIKHTSSLTAGTTIYLSPLVTAAVAIPFLGEQLTPHLLFGGGAILIGVYLANRRPMA